MKLYSSRDQINSPHLYRQSPMGPGTVVCLFGVTQVGVIPQPSRSVFPYLHRSPVWGWNGSKRPWSPSDSGSRWSTDEP